MSLVLNVPSGEKQILGRPGRLDRSRETITLETTGENPSKGEEINLRGHKKAGSDWKTPQSAFPLVKAWAYLSP